jgi:hypothetical protein
MRRFGLVGCVALTLLGVTGCVQGRLAQARGGAAGGSARELAAQKTFSDRHPAISEPRRYYNEAGSNPVVKTVAGGIGVPVGIYKETRQIFQGQ